MLIKDYLYTPLIGLNHTLRDCLLHLESINSSSGFVVDLKGKLIAVFTDGDIRRGLLSNFQLDDNFESILNKNPRYFIDKKFDILKLKKLFNEIGIHKIPICDDLQHYLYLVKDIESDFKISGDNNVIHRYSHRKVGVLILAGGFGKRMGDLTKLVPKPMLNVKGKPILEYIINQFHKYNLKDVIISLYYLPDVVKNYFKDGSNFDLKISYILEDRPLGTAGAILLVDRSKYDDLIIINGDIKSNVDFEKLYLYHVRNNSDLTICLNEFLYQCPFGVVNIHNNVITDLIEKPVTSHLISAGIYVVNTDLCNLFKFNSYIDMTDFIIKVIESKKKVLPYYLFESWSDIGNPDDLKNHNK